MRILAASILLYNASKISSLSPDYASRLTTLIVLQHIQHQNKKIPCYVSDTLDYLHFMFIQHNGS